MKDRLSELQMTIYNILIQNVINNMDDKINIIQMIIILYSHTVCS